MPGRLPIAMQLFRPGERVAVAVSGGADSVALLRALYQARQEAGLVLQVAHFHHGLRGAEADADAAFVHELAGLLGLPFFESSGDTAARAKSSGESVEEAARNLRYDFFHQLLGRGDADVVATAHTQDDQAETVLLKFLRGAWTEGLGGISPVIQVSEGRGRIVRPLLEVRRSQVEQYLNECDQPWRDDSTNAEIHFTRNRLRHELMPQLRAFNPNLDEQMARLASIARGEESHWQAEMEKLLPKVLLEGRPVRGGGRAVATSPAEKSVVLDLAQLSAWDVAVQRRILRAAARRLGRALDFFSTARLLELLEARSGAKAPLGDGLLAERTARELRLTLADPSPKKSELAEVVCPVPGESWAPEFGLRVVATAGEATSENFAILRVWKPGDRVRLRHTLKEQKVKEALQRLHAGAEEKSRWPVLLWEQRIVWMQGVEVQPTAGDPAFQVTRLS
jgi:tRNA(Ile)-lysidine synthase